MTDSNESHWSSRSCRPCAVCSCKVSRRGSNDHNDDDGSSALTATTLTRPFCVTFLRFDLRICNSPSVDSGVLNKPEKKAHRTRAIVVISRALPLGVRGH